MSAGQRIREARVLVGLTLQELADQLGITRGAVSQWESDITLPDVNKLVALSAILRCSIDWLLRGDGQDHTSHPGMDEMQARISRLELWAWGNTPPERLPPLTGLKIGSLK